MQTIFDLLTVHSKERLVFSKRVLSKNVTLGMSFSGLQTITEVYVKPFGFYFIQIVPRGNSVALVN